MVRGAVDSNLLSQVLNATSSVDREGGLALNLAALPAGYRVRVHPQIQAIDPPLRSTLTNEAGDVAINEVSDFVNPELNIAQSGARYTAVVVAGKPAWTGRHAFNPSGPLTFLVWSPQPGVVLQITTWNVERTIAELIQLAESISLLPASDWRTIYD